MAAPGERLDRAKSWAAVAERHGAPDTNRPAHAHQGMSGMQRLNCGRHALDLSRPRVMGIVNVTPDSFWEGGRFADPALAIARGRRLLSQGADIIDVGGESTRPGAGPVDEDEECARILPVVRSLGAQGALVSIDTSRPRVMSAALDAGACMINEVRALKVAGALETVARSSAAFWLMHMQGEPATMQQAPHYDDVVAEVRDFLAARASACESAGIARERIAIDPGFGFGKTLEHNLALLRGLPVLAALGYPVLVGLSRKGSLGKLTGRGPDERLAASIAAALAAVARGASIVRVHDVGETVDALKVWQAMASV
jgi:dihydropteroate synthase